MVLTPATAQDSGAGCDFLGLPAPEPTSGTLVPEAVSFPGSWGLSNVPKQPCHPCLGHLEAQRDQGGEGEPAGGVSSEPCPRTFSGLPFEGLWVPGRVCAPVLPIPAGTWGH